MSGREFISWRKNMSLANISLIQDNVIVEETLRLISWGENMSLENS